MTAMECISMNCPRQTEITKDNAHCINYKELLQEKEEKIKNLLEKNEKLEKECIKFQVHMKSLEDKLTMKIDKEYVTNTNTSSNFILPSEFHTLWEDLSKETIPDCLIDFFDSPIATFHILQELIYTSHQLLRAQISDIISKILKIFNIPNDSNSIKYFEMIIKPIFQEYYHQIFETNTTSQDFVQKIQIHLNKFYHKEICSILANDKENEFNDMMSSMNFVKMISILKKILFFIEFHDPPLKLKVEEYSLRKLEFNCFKKCECLCVEGFIKENKNCLILLNPPIMKNGYAYKKIKPIIIACDAEVSGRRQGRDQEGGLVQESIAKFEISSSKQNSFGNEANPTEIFSLIDSSKSKHLREYDILPRTASVDNQFQFSTSNINIQISPHRKTTTHSNNTSLSNSNSALNFTNILEKDNKNWTTTHTKLLQKSRSVHEIADVGGNSKSNQSFTSNNITPSHPSNVYDKDNQIITIQNLQKLQQFIHSSRSQLESNNDIDFEIFHNDECPIGTEYNFPLKGYNSKVLTTSFTNSLKTNKGIDKGNTMSVNPESQGKLYIPPQRYSDISKKKLLVFSEKKKSFAKCNGSERGPDAKILAKAIERIRSKGNPMLPHSGVNVHVIRSLSKTPKQVNTKAIGYSPRMNIIYHFNDRIRAMRLHSNQADVLSQVSGGKNTQAVSFKNKNEMLISSNNPHHDKKYSSYSSVSKEKTNNCLNTSTVENYEVIKTVENESTGIANQNQISNASSKNMHTMTKYKEYAKSKIKQKSHHFLSQNFHQANAGNNINININNNINTNTMNLIKQQSGEHTHHTGMSTNINLLQVHETHGMPEPSCPSAGKNKPSNASYSKNLYEKIKKNENATLQKDKSGDFTSEIARINDNIKKQNSIDKKMFENRTNAQTKLTVDELLSLKKNESNKRGSSTHLKDKQVICNAQNWGNNNNHNNITNGKAKFLNIKYV